jgi:formylglycine-generating enzyme required for sulfatase activity
MAEQDRRRTIELGQPDRSRLPEFGRRDKSRLPEFGVQVAGDMVVVPAGEFLMGSTDADTNASGDEKPQHVVCLDEYALDVHPVTVAQYRAFCEATGRAMPSPPNWGWLDDHPVLNVTWHDAVAYCEWADKRLPTEAEWEKAARGEDGRIWPWGNNWDARKCQSSYGGSWGSAGKTAPVGSHPEGVSPYGCHDMIGNVWEWCADWYDGSYYRNSPRQNPKGPDSAGARVLRGGAWFYINLYRLRCAYRNSLSPDDGGDGGGFRCAQDLG